MTPSRQERVFDKKYARELLRIAVGDLKSAEAIASSNDARIENAFFMAQQAIEKCLKAVLVAKGRSVPLVHDLGSLLGKIPKDCEPPYGYELIELNQYAALRRYEEGSWTPTQDEWKVVLQKTGEMVAWAAAVITAAELTSE